MALRVPLVQSRASVPSDSGIRTKKPINKYSALSDFGEALVKYDQVQTKKKAETKLLEAENRLREESREKYYDYQKNRLGKRALPDEEAGTPGVYDEYKAEVDKRIGDLTAAIPEQYQTQARQSLNSIAESYKNSIASFEAQQSANYRKELKGQKVENIKSDVYFSVESGFGLEAVQNGAKNLAQTIREMSGGAPSEEYIAQQTDELIQNSILWQAGIDSDEARLMMEDKWVSDQLSPEQRKNLETMIEQQEVEQESDAAIQVARASGVDDFGKQIELIQDMDISDDAKKMATTQINFDENQNRKVEAAKTYEIMETVINEVKQNGNAAGITPTMIWNDPAFEDVPFEKKQIMERWVTGDGKPGEFASGVRESAWFDATRKIIAGDWDEFDVMSKAGETIDVRDVKSLVGFARSETTNPKSYSQADEMFQALHEKEHSDPDKRAKIMYGVMQDVEQYKSINERYPDNKVIREMLNDNAKGFVESAWWRPDPDHIDRLQEGYPDIDEPQYKYIDDDERGVDWKTRQSLRYRDSGFENAHYSKAHDMFILGENKNKPDGYFYIVRNGIRRRVPVNTEDAETLRNAKPE